MAGAAADVYVAEPASELQELAADPSGGAVTIHRRIWTAEDLADAAIAIGAFASDDKAARFAAAARAAGVPVWNPASTPKPPRDRYWF